MRKSQFLYVTILLSQFMFETLYGIKSCLFWKYFNTSVWYNFVSKALKCYQCDSAQDEYCPETWERTDIEPTECDSLDYPAFCVKTTGIYGAIVGNRRFCSSRHMDNSCNEVNFPQDPRTYYSCIYTCSSHGCNDARRIHLFSFGTAITAFVLGTFLSSFWFYFWNFEFSKIKFYLIIY